MQVLFLNKYKPLLIFSVVVLFTAFLVLTIISGRQEFRIAALVFPFLLIATYLAIYFTEYYFYALVLFLPVSINVEDLGYGLGMSFPGEIMIAFLVVFILANILKGKFIKREILVHPISIIIYIDLAWMIISSFFSTMPFISAKYIFIRLMFLLVFYFFLAEILNNSEKINRFFWLYAISLLVVIVFATLKHSRFGFIPQVNHWAPKPFYKDHTIYGAAIVMVLPFFIGKLFLKNFSKTLKLISLGVILFFFIGIFLSYSRAVWLSIMVISLLLLAIYLKVNFKAIVIIVVLGVVSLIALKNPILFKMQEVESQRGDESLKEHISSSANIESSASNKERINRWACAFEMIQEKPVTGFGPGTYQFQYGPYQKKENMTHISTYFGDVGGVHSEYLKPFVESGILGLFTFIGIVFTTLWYAFKIIYRTKNKEIKILAITILLGLSTYYFHGLVNFFSNTDKIAVLFWGMTAFIVVLDLKMRQDKHLPKQLVK
jgi:putative inorganic carbon (HCO3(-)) transporter